jgi:hypothetical protein
MTKTGMMLSAALLTAFATQAFGAEFYIVQNSDTKRCTIVDKRPTVKMETIVGENGKTYTTREEADTAMKSVKVCDSH